MDGNVIQIQTHKHYIHIHNKYLNIFKYISPIRPMFRPNDNSNMMDAVHTDIQTTNINYIGNHTFNQTIFYIYFSHSQYVYRPYLWLS